MSKTIEPEYVTEVLTELADAHVSYIRDRHMMVTNGKYIHLPELLGKAMLLNEHGYLDGHPLKPVYELIQRIHGTQ